MVAFTHPWLGRVLACALSCSLALLLLPLPAQAADIQRWTLSGRSGERWLVSVFEQPDPGFEAGWRLRLNGLTPGQHPHHERPLRLEDGLGTRWQLANRSRELVPPGEPSPPGGSAQFDLDALVPRPEAALPLRLVVTMAEGGDRELMLSPAAVAALSGLPVP